jgi:hypothetical protein
MPEPSLNHSAWNTCGAQPIQVSGADADRGIRSRLVAESVWLPSAFLPDAGAAWSEENGRLRLTVPVHGEEVQASVQVGPAGELRAVRAIPG